MVRLTRTFVAALAIVCLLAAACGNDDDAAPEEPETTEAPETTDEPDTTDEPEATEAPEPTEATDEQASGECPDVPLPDDAEDALEAPVDYDGDGDGTPDTLTVYRQGTDWWLHADWSGGGSAAVMIDDAGSMGARPLGGHDLLGDGSDEAWIAIFGPAAGSIVGVYHAVDCDLVPLTDLGSGGDFRFTVTATLGNFTGASCNGLGDIDLFTGELAGADSDEYLVSQQPHTVDASGDVTGEMGDAGSITGDEVGDYATLDCGALADAL